MRPIRVGRTLAQDDPDPIGLHFDCGEDMQQRVEDRFWAATTPDESLWKPDALARA